jgi:adenine-specific DNA-methyltransferase
MMAKATNPTPKTVETITHVDANRKNIPTAEFESVMHMDENYI